MTHCAVAAARKWLGTPFQEGASVCMIGADCAGLIEGVARDLGIAYPCRAAVANSLLVAARAFMVPIDTPQAGSIILLSREPGGLPLHGALVTDTQTLIHSHWRAGVVENRFGDWFARRVTHVFAWPTLESLPPLRAGKSQMGNVAISFPLHPRPLSP